MSQDLPPFTESMRYDYPLTSQSVVLDAGFHEGNWALQISAKYGCWVEAYEPVDQFYQAALPKVQGTKVRLIKAAVGGSFRDETFHIKGCMSGAFADSPELHKVRVLDVFRLVEHRDVDLLKLNIEGMEYEVLERLVSTGWIKAIQDIQVQFHDCAPDAVARHAKLHQDLTKTHRLTFDSPWCWANYRRNQR